MTWQSTGRYRNRLSVTLDSGGNGSVTFQVRSSNHRIQVEEVQVYTNQGQSNPPYPTATAYAGGQQTGQAEGATWTGNQDIMRGRMDMDAGTDLTIAFTGGVAGTLATAIAEGEQYLWR